MDDSTEGRLAEIEGSAVTSPSGALTTLPTVSFDALLSIARSGMEDGKRLDWLDSQSWIAAEKTDESDNNGVGLEDSAVVVRSCHPDGRKFKGRFGATFREAIDAAKSAVENPSPEGQ